MGRNQVGIIITPSSHSRFGPEEPIGVQPDQSTKAFISSASSPDNYSDFINLWPVPSGGRLPCYLYRVTEQAESSRLYRYGPPDVVHIDDLDVPPPQDREVLIKVSAASLNPLDVGLMKSKPYTFPYLRAAKDRKAGGSAWM